MVAVVVVVVILYVMRESNHIIRILGRRGQPN